MRSGRWVQIRVDLEGDIRVGYVRWACCAALTGPYAILSFISKLANSHIIDTLVYIQSNEVRCEANADFVAQRKNQY